MDSYRGAETRIHYIVSNSEHIVFLDIMLNNIRKHLYIYDERSREWDWTACLQRLNCIVKGIPCVIINSDA